MVDLNKDIKYIKGVGPARAEILNTIGIFTLGDLCRFTEQELLGSKNFGETSLVEIKDMLQAKGLSLGQTAGEAPSRAEPAPMEDDMYTPDEQLMMNQPLSFLDLSVRAKKCMNRLNLTTVRELIHRTADELLDCKNFGVTSLNEIREKLAEHGLKLRGE